MITILTASEFLALSSIYRYRILTVSQINEILSYEAPHVSDDAQALTQRLQEKGLAEVAKSREGFSLWSVTREGIKSLRADAYFRGASIDDFKRSEKQICIHPRHIRHHIQMVDFVIAFMQRMQKMHGIKGIIYNDEHGGVGQDVVRPDGTIIIPKEVYGKLVIIFLESDMGTEDKDRISEKFSRYYAHLTRSDMPLDAIYLLAFFCQDSAIPQAQSLESFFDQEIRLDGRKEERRNDIKYEAAVLAGGLLGHDDFFELEGFVGNSVDVLNGLFDYLFPRAHSKIPPPGLLIDGKPMFTDLAPSIDRPIANKREYSAYLGCPVLGKRFLVLDYNHVRLCHYSSIGFLNRAHFQIAPNSTDELCLLVVLPRIDLLKHFLKSFPPQETFLDRVWITTPSALANAQSPQELFFQVTPTGFATLNRNLSGLTSIDKREVMRRYR